MKLQRYYSSQDRVAQAIGVVLMVAGGLGLARLVVVAPDGLWAAVLALPVLVIVIGIHFRRRVSAAVDVDLEGRRYSLIRDGKPAGSGDLDELAPLRTSRDVVSGRRNSGFHYVVKTARADFLALDADDSPFRARQKMEALARAWGVSSQALDGPLREHAAFDGPIHARLRGDAAAWEPVTLKPEWRVEIAPALRGHAIVSHRRSFQPLLDNPVPAVLLVLLVILAVNLAADFTAREAMLHDPFGRALLALGAVFACVLAWKVGRGLLDIFRLGTIEIDDRGVAYRWSRLDFDRIREVSGRERIEIVGDGRVLTVPASFCPPEAVQGVAHEIQRLILEASARRALASGERDARVPSTRIGG